MEDIKAMGFQAIPDLISPNERYPLAAVCGRFQPFHFGHLEYVMRAKEHCDFLCIGITQFDVANLVNSPQDIHRQDPANNPLDYFERHEMITAALTEAGLRLHQFSIFPFPIDEPARITSFLPSNIPVFTTICDEWNLSKIGILEQAGYKVKTLFSRDSKEYSGMVIRECLRAGKPNWREMVPRSVVTVLEKYQIPDRLFSPSQRYS